MKNRYLVLFLWLFVLLGLVWAADLQAWGFGHSNDRFFFQKEGKGNKKTVLTVLKNIQKGRSKLGMEQQKKAMIKIVSAIDEEIDIGKDVVIYKINHAGSQKTISSLAGYILKNLPQLEQAVKNNNKKPNLRSKPMQKAGDGKGKEHFLGDAWLADGIDGLRVRGDYAYAAARALGFVIFDVSDPARVKTAGHLTGSFVNDVEVVDNYAYLVCGRRRFKGGKLLVVDISDKSNPKVVARESLPRGAIRISAYGPYRLLCLHDAGLLIYDCSQPAAPRFVTRFFMPYNPEEYPVPAKKTFLRNHTWSAKADGKLAYICDDIAGVRIVDISDIKHPRQISRFMLADGFKGFCNDVVRDGNYLYLAYDFGYLVVVDISDIKHPRLAGHFTPNLKTGWKDSDKIAIRLVKVGDLIYISQSRLGGVAVIDVKDPANPRPAHFYRGNSSTWGIAVDNGKVYAGEMPIEGHKWGGMEIFNAVR